MNKKLFISFIVLSFLASACNESSVLYSDGTVRLADSQIQVAVADTPQEQSLGLSGREGLKENQGMWFVFDKASQYSFWMKGMNFSIDIIWIKDSKVVDISPQAEAQPGTAPLDLPLYQPRDPVDRVLELRSGWAVDHRLKIGDRVEYVPKP